MNFLRKVSSGAPWQAICLALSLTFTTGLTSSPANAQAKNDLDKVLSRLDDSAAKFKSAEADIVVENTQTEPYQVKDTQTGTVVFQRKSGQLSMSMHLKTFNGKPAIKDAVYADGVFKLYDPALQQEQVFKAGNRSDIDTYLAVGFGGSGKDLEKNWVVTYGGQDTVGGVATAKLEMIPRQESVKANYNKVILWIDMEKGLAVKQQSFDSDGNNRAVTYSNLKPNVAIPATAFEIKTAPGTHIIAH